MTDTPWLDDACSLVDAFRAGDRSPKEELEATLAAIEASELNNFSFLDPERALAAAEHADVSKPFGGVPVGIKELDQVQGWPDTQASLVFADRIATYTGEGVRRFTEDGGAVAVGLTTASEFGGLNVSISKLNGVAHNPWRHGRTAGGSSGGSASAVAGGLVSIASGVDARDPQSLPNPGGWESGLGSHDLAGKRVAILPSIAGVTLEPGVEERIRAAAGELIAATGMVEVDITLELPNLAAQWAFGNLSTLLAELGPRWPGCAPELTDEIALGCLLAQSLYNLHMAAVAEARRVEANAAMAGAFDRVDYIISSTNPGPAFAAESWTSSPSDTFLDQAKANPAARAAFRAIMAGVRVAGGVFPRMSNALTDAVVEQVPDLVTMGGLTIISNVYGNPAASIPAGLVDGLPVGMQVLAPHHRDAELFDVALAYEREVGWPKVAPSVTGSAPVGV